MTSCGVTSVHVQWPDKRGDVLNGLDLLAAERVLDDRGQDPRWPNLTNAIHWVVDDTWWDHSDPSESVGTILVDLAEAQAVAAVVALVVDVSQRHAAEATDAAWYSDVAWAQVRQAASDAAAMLQRNDAQGL